MHDGELGLGSDHDDGRAVGGPAPEHGTAARADRDVAGSSVVFTRARHSHHPDAMVLVEHGPGQVDEPATAWFEVVERHVDAMEVAVDAGRAHDPQPSDCAT